MITVAIRCTFDERLSDAAWRPVQVCKHAWDLTVPQHFEPYTLQYCNRAVLRMLGAYVPNNIRARMDANDDDDDDDDDDDNNNNNYNNN